MRDTLRNYWLTIDCPRCNQQHTVAFTLSSMYGLTGYCHRGQGAPTPMITLDPQRVPNLEAAPRR